MVRKARSHNKVQSVSSQDTQNYHSAQDIADAFLKQYYNCLNNFPEQIHKFYKEGSTVSIPVDDGSIRSVTTIKEIRKAILESDITDRKITRLNVHAQDSIANSVVIGVVGVLSKDNTMKRFSQTFLLAPQARGFYVHNDFFQFLITNDDTEDNLVPMKDQTSTEDDKISMDSSKNMSSMVLSDKRSDTKKDVKKKSYASIITKASSLTIPEATVEVSQKTNGQSSTPPKNEKDIATEAAREVLKMDKSSKSSSSDETIDTQKGQDEKNLPLGRQDEVEEKESYATNLAKPRLPTKTGSSSTASAKPSAASKNIGKTIYVKNLPLKVTRRTLTSAVKKFGNVKHKNIQIRTIRDGFRYAFMEFNSQKAAKEAVEAGYIQFDGYECEVEYMKGDTQGQEGHDKSTGNSRGSVGDNKSGDNNGKGNGSKHVV